MEKGTQFGSYTLIERIGHGGMGEVWRARHQLLDRQAAIKLIRPDALGISNDAAGAAMLKRFKREAQTTSGLRSPNTIALYDFGLADDGTFYYAMEMLEGLNLQLLVERYGAVDPARVVFILDQVCDSLAEAHHAGLVHRDVKPANIYLCRLGLQHDFVKVLDFGLVKHEPREGVEQTALTADGVAPGSPAYIAPELASGAGQVDARADIYSLGCVAYWLLTGTLVFPAESPLDAVVAHVKEIPEPLAARSELDISPELEAVVMDCLAKDPSARPQTAKELKDRLATCPFDKPWNGDRAEDWWRRHKPAPSLDEPSLDEPDAEQQTKAAPDIPGGGVPSSVAAPAPAIDTGEAMASLEVTDAVKARREFVRSQLQHHFTASRIDLDELEKRLMLVRQATTEGELEQVVADLEPTPVPIVERPERALAEQPARQTIVNVFSGTERSGLWRPPAVIRAVNVFGGARLDFRDAELQPGVTEVYCASLFGGLEIVVPPDLYVDIDGFAFFGGFDRKQGKHPPATPGDRSLKITGWAVFGGTTVTVKPR